MTEREFLSVLADAPRPLDQPTTERLIKAWYAIPGNEIGGSLHVVLDDNNWEREHVEFCREYASERGDLAGVAFAEALLTLTDEQLEAWLGDDRFVEGV